MTVDELIDGWEAAWSGKDAGAFEALCAPGIHYEDPLTGEPLEGAEALGRHAERLWAAFPDARLERTGERLTNDRFVAAPSKLLATHRAALEGLPRPTASSSCTASSIASFAASGCCGCAGSSTCTTPRRSWACCRRAGRWGRRRC